MIMVNDKALGIFDLRVMERRRERDGERGDGERDGERGYRKRDKELDREGKRKRKGIEEIERKREREI